MAPTMKQIRIGTLESRIECMEKTLRVLERHYSQFKESHEFVQLQKELTSARENCLKLIERIEHAQVVR